MQQTKEQTFARWGFYLLGMVLLALGLTLNTKTGLGASAIVSVPFTVSQTTGWDFGNLTLVVYCLFVAAQFVIKGKKRRWNRPAANSAEHRVHPFFSMFLGR